MLCCYEQLSLGPPVPRSDRSSDRTRREYAATTQRFVELLVSPTTAELLRQLRAGLPQRTVSGLPLRSQQLVARLDRGGLLEHRKDAAGRLNLWLTSAAGRMVPPAPERPAFRQLTAAQLQVLGLPNVPPFQIRTVAAKGGGRPRGSRTGMPAVYVHRLPPADFDPTRQLDETVLALLLLDGRSARHLVEAHRARDWAGLRQRLRDEGLETRAAHFGLRSMIGMRRRAAPRATRADAHRRARTEPKATRPSRARS